mgnify:FL=1
MHIPLNKLVPLVVALTLTSLSLPGTARAQTYPIDCAILLCLSGGWPASVPCARARAEFIRRITPWPVEPPLQIWRCPMGASYQMDRRSYGTERFFDILLEQRDDRPGQSLPLTDDTFNRASQKAVWNAGKGAEDVVSADFVLRYVQDRADVDISGPEFNFVRSIRVFDVRFASQRTVGENDQCRRYALVYLGTYGRQGDFSWVVSAPTALPDAHVGLEGWGADCPSIYNRSVFVDWRDYEGTYGFEQVNY